MERAVKVQEVHNGKCSETQLRKEAMTAGVAALVKELRRIAKIVLVNLRYELSTFYKVNHHNVCFPDFLILI